VIVITEWSCNWIVRQAVSIALSVFYFFVFNYLMVGVKIALGVFSYSSKKLSKTLLLWTKRYSHRDFIPPVFQ